MLLASHPFNSFRIVTTISGLVITSLSTFSMDQDPKSSREYGRNLIGSSDPRVLFDASDVQVERGDMVTIYHTRFKGPPSRKGEMAHLRFTLTIREDAASFDHRCGNIAS